MMRDIRRLLNAICHLGMVYDWRYGENEDHVRIAVQTCDGRRQYGSYPVPCSALDDLVQVLEDLKWRRSRENTELGYNQELRADRGLKKLAGAADPEAARETIRGNYAEAARRIVQPDDVPR